MRRAEVDAIIAELRAHGLDAIRAYAGRRGYLIHVRRAEGTLYIQSREEAETLLAKVHAASPRGP
jgi:hypothetical protein